MSLRPPSKPSSVTSLSSILKRRGLEPPVRRVLAVDAGSRCIRLLLLENRFGKLKVLRQDALDLQEEGLVSPEELKAHLQTTLADWGRPPLALTLPQQIAVSQIVDLPPVPDSEARQLIEAETIKLSGLSETAMVYDFTRVPTLTESRHRPQRFGGFTRTTDGNQEGFLRSQIGRVGIQPDFGGR